MRAPQVYEPGPVLEHRDGDHWVSQRTVRVGIDIYQADAPALGDWALVRPPAATKKSGGGVSVGLLAGGIALLAFVGVVIGIRLARRRRTR
jgi:hypothetical protein